MPRCVTSSRPGKILDRPIATNRAPPRRHRDSSAFAYAGEEITAIPLLIRFAPLIPGDDTAAGATSHPHFRAGSCSVILTASVLY